MERSLYTRAILIGGIISGVISGTPLVGYANCCCCCIWYIMGGLIASYVICYYAPVYPGDGAGTLAGLGAGALGGLINSIMNMVVQLISPSRIGPQTVQPFIDKLPPKLQDSFIQGMQQGTTLGSLILGMFFLIIIACAVATFGGFVGMRIFRPLRMMVPAPWPQAQYPWPPQGPGPPYGPGYGPPPGPQGGMPPPPGEGQGPPQEGRQPGQQEDRSSDKPLEKKDKNPGDEPGSSGGSTPPERGG